MVLRSRKQPILSGSVFAKPKITFRPCLVYYPWFARWWMLYGWKSVRSKCVCRKKVGAQFIPKFSCQQTRRERHSRGRVEPVERRPERRPQVRHRIVVRLHEAQVPVHRDLQLVVRATVRLKKISRSTSWRSVIILYHNGDGTIVRVVASQPRGHEFNHSRHWFFFPKNLPFENVSTFTKT